MNESHTKQQGGRRLFVVVGVTFLALIITVLLRFFAFPEDFCTNDNLRESVSPNATIKAVLFRRDCGATTTYSTQVSILPVSRKLPNESGNVYVAGGEPTVIVRWIDDRHLSISGGGAATVFKHLSVFAGVQITYD